MATIPISYYWLKEVALALETDNIRAVEAFVEMHGVKIFQLEGKDCIKSTDLPKIAKGIQGARKEPRLLVPLVFAAKELGITENDYLLTMSATDHHPVIIDGAKYIEKSVYLHAGGKLLRPDLKVADTDQDQQEMDF